MYIEAQGTNGKGPRADRAMRVTGWQSLAASAGAALHAALRRLSFPSDLRGLIEGFQAHRRVALSAIRGRRTATLAAVEIERLRDGLLPIAADRACGLTDLPFVSRWRGPSRWSMSRSRLPIGGDLERARALLDQLRQPLADWRQAKGIRLFSDCIAEISAAYGRSTATGRRRRTWTTPRLAARS